MQAAWRHPDLDQCVGLLTSSIVRKPFCTQLRARWLPEMQHTHQHLHNHWSAVKLGGACHMTNRVQTTAQQQHRRHAYVVTTTLNHCALYPVLVSAILSGWDPRLDGQGWACMCSGWKHHDNYHPPAPQTLSNRRIAFLSSHELKYCSSSTCFGVQCVGGCVSI